MVFHLIPASKFRSNKKDDWKLSLFFIIGVVMSKVAWGYIFLALAQVAVSCNVVMGKYLGQVMPVYFYIGGRFFISTIFLFSIKQFKGTRIASPQHPEGDLTPKDWLLLAGQAITAGFLFNILFFTGMQYTTATSAGVIASTLPAVLTIMAWLILKEKIRFNKILAIMLCMSGILVLSLDNNQETGKTGSLLGDSVVFLAMIPEAYYSILGKQLRGRITALGSSFVVNLFSFLMLLPFMISSMSQMTLTDMTTECYILLILGGIFSSGFFLLWSKGIESVPASTAAIFGGVVPVTTAAFAIIFLGETPSILTYLGMAMVLISLWAGSKFPGLRKSSQIPGLN